MDKIFLVFITFICVFCTDCQSVSGQELPPLKVSEFGAKGDGKTDDTQSINAALDAATSRGRSLSFENRIYLVTSLVAAGTQGNTLPNLSIVGNDATIRSISTTKENVLSLKYIDTISIVGLRIDGNLANKPDGHGVGIYYCKDLTLEFNEIYNCKYTGLLVAWTKLGKIRHNRIHDNGDGKLPSDGILVHSMGEGEISHNLLYNNNPNEGEDGDGIQIGTIDYAIPNYFDPTAIGTIRIFNNVSFNHSRRGIKIQRSNVEAFENILFDNAIGVSLVRSQPIKDINVFNNYIFDCYHAINTDGGGKINILNSKIVNNRIFDGIRADDLSINDSESIVISNFFLTPKGADRVQRISVSANSKGINKANRVLIESTRGNQENPNLIDATSVGLHFLNQTKYTAEVGKSDSKLLKCQVLVNRGQRKMRVTISDKPKRRVTVPPDGKLVIFSRKEETGTIIL